eukprot:UN04369
MYQATTTGCGLVIHCLCRKCVDRLHNSDHAKCPYCSNRIFRHKVQSNNEKQMEIYMLNAKCAEGGCGWVGMLLQWENHMNEVHPLYGHPPQAHRPHGQAQPGAPPSHSNPADDPDTFQIKIKDMLGATRTMQVRPDMTIKEFKKLFENEHGMKIDEQKFAWHGRTMREDKTFQSLGVYEGSTIHSLKKFTGGIFVNI